MTHTQLLRRHWSIPALCGALACGTADENAVRVLASLNSADGSISGTLSLQSEWGQGYCANVALTNIGQRPISAWSAVVGLGGNTLANLWNARGSAGGDQLSVTNESHNGTLAVGASTSFGFCTNGPGRPTLLSVAATTTGGGGAGNTGGSGNAGGSGSAGGTAGSSSGGGGSGTCTDVRPTGTDWDEATCAQWASQTNECSAAWMIDNHYCDRSCGRCSGGSGGASGSGGAGSGGAGGGGGITSTCTEADRQVCGNGSGRHCGLTFEYWKDRGDGCLTNTADGFRVEWSNINNLLGRKGMRPGSKNQIVTYTADYRPNGNSYLCVYGWTRGPLVEYYIVDSWGSWRPPGGTSLGTVNSDGGTYDIYRTQRVNQPSIDGTATFNQYWSVRRAKRTSGTITVANHFNAWASKGLTLGNLYEVSMTVEGYQSSGSADVSVSMR